MLSLEHIVLTRGNRTVLNDLSVEAERGNVIALLGPNGAGKTTVLHFIAGVLKNDSGHIYYQGQKLDTTSLEWRRKLSYVLDDGGTIPLLTVEEQLFLQCSLTGLSRAESIERAGLVIELLDMRPYREYRGEELSAGLRKRLGIGLGIVRDAEVFLFDEPLGSLDVEAMMIFTGILEALNSSGRVVIIASHSSPLLRGLCNRVWALSGGKAEDYTNREELLELFKHPLPSGRANNSDDINIPWMLKSI
jgi:ABC-type multidrug transport system ATPase subunit